MGNMIHWAYKRRMSTGSMRSTGSRRSNQARELQVYHRRTVLERHEVATTRRATKGE
jgi:hypothetical protein